MMTEFKHKEYAVCFQTRGDFLRNYEPIPRKHGGDIEHIGHKYQIKDGITIFEAMVGNCKLRIQEMSGVSIYAHGNP